MTTFPPDQTLVLKGLRKNITQSDVHRFVNAATPYVQSIHMCTDKYPQRETHPNLAYLNYQSSTQAKLARQSIDQAITVAKAKGDTIDPSVLVVYVKEAGAKSLFPPAFSVWIGNLKDSDENEVEKKITNFGQLVTHSSHGLPPFKIFDSIAGNKSAIFNFVNFMDAKKVLDACALKLLTFGKTEPTYGIGHPQTNTKLILDILERCRTQNCISLSFAEAEGIANSQGAHKPERWIDALRLCTSIFVIDDRHATITIREGIEALERLVIASIPPRPDDAPPPTTSSVWASGGGPSSNAGLDYPHDPWPNDVVMDGAANDDYSHVCYMSDSVTRLAIDDADRASTTQPARALAVAAPVQGLSAVPALPAAAAPAPRGGLAPPATAVAAPAQPRPPTEWDCSEVAELLCSCSLQEAARAAVDNGVDGKTIVDLFSDEEGRALLSQPIEQGGLGLGPIQVRRVKLELRNRGAPVDQPAAAGGGGGGGGSSSASPLVSAAASTVR